MLKSFYHKALIEVGLDEVGRGCLAGPLVVAAVILPKDFKCLELKDSKLCSPELRQRLALVIYKEAISWAIEFGSLYEIDRYNIPNTVFLAMDRAVKKLVPPPQHLLIDGNRFKTTNNIPYTTVIKGDNLYASIAAASIIAKTFRDNYMRMLSHQYPYYKWENNKGYPTLKHRQAIQQYGISIYHRKRFTIKYI